MNRRAFTLVELLVVIAIIGLLSTVAVVALKQSGVNARNQKRKADLVQLSKALELYYSDNGGYPLTSGSWWGTCGAAGSHGDSGANGWIPYLASTYLASLPRDPTSGKTSTSYCGCVDAWACYLYMGSATDYKLLADCTPEGTIPASDPFNDPKVSRTGCVYAVYTPGASQW
jgi:prepilin-type N-terminal cleavage/methylation domain-containing protein